MRALPLASVLFASLASSVASAQTVCAEGRVPTMEGYCCWPMQTWSAERARCEGPPACPAGMGAEGDDCVGDARPPERETGVAPPASYGGGGADPAVPAAPAWRPPPLELSPEHAGAEWPSSAARPGASARRELRRDDDLLAWGLATLAAGYAVSVGTAISAFVHTGIFAGAPGLVGFDATCHDATGGLSLIPVVGAMLGAIVHGTCTVPVYAEHIGVAFRTQARAGASNEPGFAALAVVATALELAGGIMALVALTVPRTVTLYDDPSTARVSLVPRLALSVSREASVAGVELRIEHW